MQDAIFTATGKNVSAKVVKARGVDGEIGYFEVMYEWSRPKNIWRYHTTPQGHIKIFYTLGNAKAAAKRIPW